MVGWLVVGLLGLALLLVGVYVLATLRMAAGDPYVRGVWRERPVLRVPREEGEIVLLSLAPAHLIFLSALILIGVGSGGLVVGLGKFLLTAGGGS